MIPFFVIICITAMILTGIVIMLCLHKRFVNRNFLLIGQPALVESALDPEGSVIIRGEIWRARSVDGSRIASRNAVRVVRADNLYLLVKGL